MSKVILDAIKANPNITAEQLGKLLDEEKNKEDFNINLEDEQGYRALYYLILAGNIGAIKLLVSPQINASLIIKPKGKLGETFVLNFINGENKELFDILFYPNITACFFDLYRKSLVIADTFLIYMSQKKFNKSNLEILQKIVDELSVLNENFNKMVTRLSVHEHKHLPRLYHNVYQAALDNVTAFEFFQEIINFFNSQNKEKIAFNRSLDFFKKYSAIKSHLKITSLDSVFASHIKQYLTELLEKYFEENNTLKTLLFISIAFLNALSKKKNLNKQ